MIDRRNKVTRETGANRSGIALVIVLGFLALMMVTGVAFSIFMRTERVAAGNFKNDVQARQLLQVALTRALEAVDARQKSDGDPIYPLWDALWSSNGSRLFVGMLGGEARDYAPFGALFGDGTNSYRDPGPTIEDRDRMWDINAVRGATLINLSDGSHGIVADGSGRFLWTRPSSGSGTGLAGGKLNRWQIGDVYRLLLPEWTNVVAADGQVVGRIGFLVLNASGLLDANFVGGTNRGIGASPAEIQLGKLFDETEVINQNRLALDRQDDGRYETLQDFGHWATNRGLGRWPAHFVTYSAFSDRTNTGAYIGPNMALWDENQIRGAFTNSGINDPTHLNHLWQALLDYVDADSVPRNLNGPGTEAVPMINEVRLRNRVLPGMTNSWQGIDIEWFYPYVVAANPGSYRMNYAIEFSPGDNGDPVFVPANVSGSESFYVGGTGVYGVVTVDRNKHPSELIQVSSIAPTRIHYVANVRVWITLEDGTAVDSVTNGLGLPLAIDINPVVVGMHSSGIECADPRFNWLTPAAPGVLSAHWRRRYPPGIGTIGEPNGAMLARFTDTAAYNIDRDASMYVANRPLQSVGELGFLPYAPWQTIQLCDRPRPENNPPENSRHNVLKFFRVRENGDRPWRGLVNINTQVRDVLATLFYEMPREEYLDGNARAPLTWSNAVDLAEYVIANGPYASVADLGRLGGWTSVVSSARQSELVTEALIRNTAELVGTRQQYFVIFLAAEVTRNVELPTGEFMTSVLAGQRAVAEVWRDPEPNASGQRPCFIRFYRVLSK